MRNLKVTLAYDGTNYYGFQYQPYLPTIQGTIEAAWSRTLGFPVRLYAAGRTDRGVHAEGQVVNFWDPGILPLPDLQRRLLFALPEDISILSLQEVSPAFHARFSARLRTYIYRIQTDNSPSPFWSRFAAWWPQSFPITAWNEILSIFVGKHTFWAFCGGGVPRDNSTRTVTSAWAEAREPGLVITISGYSFLPRMVRMIIGAALMVLKGQATPEALQAALIEPTTKFALPAPPQGLCLQSVSFEEVLH